MNRCRQGVEQMLSGGAEAAAVDIADVGLRTGIVRRDICLVRI